MALEVKLIEPPKYGSVYWNGVKWVYTPNTNYPEDYTDSWLYALNVDGVVSKGITEYYNPKNQVPLSINPLFLVDPRSKYRISVRDLVVDDYITIDKLRILHIGTPKNGKIEISQNQDFFTYEANNALNAIEELSYVVTDGQFLTEGVFKIKYVAPIFLGTKIVDYVAYLKYLVDTFAIVPPTSANWDSATSTISSISADWLTLNTEKYNAAFDYVEANDQFLIASYQKDPFYSGLTSLIQTYSASWDDVLVDATNLNTLLSPLTTVWQNNTVFLNSKYFSWNDNIPLYDRLSTLYSANTSKYDDVYSFINSLSTSFDPTSFRTAYGNLSSKWDDVSNTVTTKRSTFGFDAFATRKYDAFVSTVSTLSVQIPALNTFTNTKNAYWASNSSISSISATALSGAATQNLVSRNLNVFNDLIIKNNLRVLGPKTQIDTTLNTLCSFEIKNTGTGDALTVDKTGLNNVLRLGNTLYVKSVSNNVGINFDPKSDSQTLTISGNISATGKIYPDTIGDQMTLYKSVSSGYETTTTYFTNNSSTVNTFRTSLPVYDNAYNYVRTNSGDITRLLAPDYSAFDAFTKSSSGGSVLGLTLTGGNYLSGGGNIVDFKNKDFTVEAWIKMPTLPTNNTTNTYTASSYTLLGSSGVSFVVNLSTMFCVNGATPLNAAVHGMSANRWHHVAYVRNVSTGNVEYYVDGFRKATAPLLPTVSIATSPRTVIGAYSPPVSADARYFKGAISNLKVTNGEALYKSNFTPNPNKFLNDSFVDTVPLYYNDVSLLLSGEEPPVIDNSLSGRTLITGAGVSSDPLSAKFGDHSIYFNGTTNAFLDVEYDSSLDFSGQFCLEFWFWSGSNTGEKGLFTKSGGTVGWNIANGHEVSLFLQNNNFIARYNSTGQANGVTLSGVDSVITVNDWNHCALTYDGTTYRSYLNGKVTGTSILPLALPTTRNRVRFGDTFKAAIPFANFLGYINGIRYTKGQARYTTTTIDPTTIQATYSNLNNVTLLINQRNSSASVDAKNNILIKDSSNRKNQFTFWGQPVVSKKKPYAGAGNSIYFDSFSNISINGSATNKALDFSGVGDWTIDFWINFSKISATQAIFGGNGGDSIQNNIICQMQASNYLGWWIQGSARWNVTDGDSIKLIPAVQQNTWYHCIITRKANEIYQYLDGVLVNLVSSTLAINKRTVDLVIGSFLNKTNPFQGYLCDMRFTQGKSLYSPYTYYKPATAAIFKDKIEYNTSSVSLLTLQDTNFLDGSILNNTLTAVGVMAYEPTSVTTPRLSAIGSITMSTLSSISAVMDKDANFRTNANKLDEAVTFVNNTIPAGYDETNYFYQFNNVTGTTASGLVYVPKACKINEVFVYTDVNTSLEVDVLSCVKGVIDFPNQTRSLIDKTIGAAPVVLNSEIKKSDKILNKWVTTLDDATTLRIDVKSNTIAKDVNVVINTTKLT